MKMLMKAAESQKSSSDDDDDDEASDEDPPLGFHFTDESNKESYRDILNKNDNRSGNEEEEDQLPSVSISWFIFQETLSSILMT